MESDDEIITRKFMVNTTRWPPQKKAMCGHRSDLMRDAVYKCAGCSSYFCIHCVFADKDNDDENAEIQVWCIRCGNLDEDETLNSILVSRQRVYEIGRAHV